jgi:hypothetical protein
MLRVVVSSTAELVLGCSPSETSQVEVTNDLVAKFRRWEELCSRLEGLAAMICDLLLGLPPSQARWADCLTEATGRLEAELIAQRLVDAELGALWTSTARVQDMVLGNADGPSSLVASLSMVVELLEGRIDTVATNGVCWGT